MLYSTPLVLASLLPFSLAAATFDREIQKRTTCYDVYLFLANGFKEPRPGRVDAVLSSVCNGLPSCSGEDITWDISLSYCGQLNQGVANGKSQINAYVAACPNSQIVPVGYSLGAQVVGDILGGVNSDTFYGCQESASAALGSSSSQIAAAVLLGNPKHVASQSYNYGDGSAKNGQYPRTGNELAGLNTYSCLLQDICELDDPICALGNNGTDHEQYITHYGVEATAFIRGKLSEGGSCRSQASTSIALSSTLSTSTHVASSTSGASTIKASTTGSITTDASGAAASSSSPADSSITASPTTAITTYVPIALSNTDTVSMSTYSPSTFSASTTDWAVNLPTAVLSVFTAATSSVVVSSVVPSNSTIIKPTLSSSATPSDSGISASGAYQNSANLALAFVAVLAIKVLAF